MFSKIILAVLFTALVMTVLYVIDRDQQKAREIRKLQLSNKTLQRRLTGYSNREREARERDAYNRGLYIGRETDTLYRKVLSRYEKGEQVTIMMNGEER